MIISRTPFRVSFFGGGTDYPAWFREHGGSVLSTSIDKYCYLSCRYLPPFFEHHSRIIYSKIEMVKANDDIQHPAVRGILKYLGVEQGVEIHHDADLPARTGLGSSSSFAVGLLHAVHALQNKMADKLQLARQAIHVEQEILKENVGCQDQIVAAVGGLNRIDFDPRGDFYVKPLTIGRPRRNELRSHLMLFFTGISRIATVIAQEQLARIKETQPQLKRMHEMVDEAENILAGGRSLDDFGALLHESWLLKKSLSSKVSSPRFDQIYDEARSAGALGGKLLGAGGGGFLLLFAHPERHDSIRQRLRGLTHVPFHFESEGSRIMVYQPESHLEDIPAGLDGRARA